MKIMTVSIPDDILIDIQTEMILSNMTNRSELIVSCIRTGLNLREYNRNKPKVPMDKGKIYDLDNICFSPEEFRTAVMKAKPGQAILYDEAPTTLGKSLSALKLFKEFRDKQKEKQSKKGSK